MQTNWSTAVGLFGTCGQSTWREPYYQALEEEGIPFFDPQIQPETHGRSWCEADIENEIRHLERNPVVMFKVTGETTGLRSLLEIVKSIQNPLQFIIVILDPLNADHKDFATDPRLQALEDMLCEGGMKVPNILKDVHAARQWTRQVVENQTSPLVTIVTTDEEAIERILLSYAVSKLPKEVQHA